MQFLSNLAEAFLHAIECVLGDAHGINPAKCRDNGICRPTRFIRSVNVQHLRSSAHVSPS